MKLSAAGKKLIQTFESCQQRLADGRFKAYVCPAGVLTIGWGHTATPAYPIKSGEVWDQRRCDDAFADDMGRFEKAVNERVRVPLTQGQYDALVSFAYNAGIGALGSSTLLRKLNARDYGGAALEFHRWNQGGGKVLPGLVRRRAAEALLFQGIADLNYDGKADAMPQAVTRYPRTGGTGLSGLF